MEELQDYSPIVKARTFLVAHQPFFATLLLSMPLIEAKTDEEKAFVPTFGVNGLNIIYNPDFAEKLDIEELVGVLAHEVMHIALMHPFRMGSRIPKVWNYAGDFAINLILTHCDFKLPKGVLLDDKYVGWDSETIYAELMKNAKILKMPDGYGGPLEGDLKSFEGGESDRAMDEHKAKVMVDKAMAVAKMMGNLPSDLEKTINHALEGESNWKEQLRRFMTEPLKDNESWTKQKRHLISQNIYLPALYSLGIGTVAIIIDTSGSVYERTPDFIREVQSICEDCKPKQIIVIQVDAKVQLVTEYEAGDPIEAKIRGGGGTDLREGFKYLAEKGIEPAVCVVCTDMETPFPDGSDMNPIPTYPVIWASTEKQHTGPFGETIYI